ncbi:STAS domain-containing protein [Actinoplanes sp. NPDC023714]|uniref:STAS domain-containing protein n=1 Tax=Actinoplanes sp. NPDC023714 TaxID=3154322 RepID=UPI0033DA9BFE
MPDDYFMISREPSAPGPIRLSFSGDLDMGARDEIRDALIEAVKDADAAATADDAEATAGAVLADLRGVRFIDSEAVSAILEGYLAAERAGLGFRLSGARGIVRRVFEVIGLEHLFDD